jgi:hypothetical protein
MVFNTPLDADLDSNFCLKTKVWPARTSVQTCRGDHSAQKWTKRTFARVCATNACFKAPEKLKSEAQIPPSRDYRGKDPG